MACQTATFSWSGGTSPYTVLALAVNSAGKFTQINTTSPTVDFEVNFPGGSTIYLNVQSVGATALQNTPPSFTKTYYVYNSTDEAW